MNSEAAKRPEQDIVFSQQLSLSKPRIGHERVESSSRVSVDTSFRIRTLPLTTLVLCNTMMSGGEREARKLIQSGLGLKHLSAT